MYVHVCCSDPGPDKKVLHLTNDLLNGTWTAFGYLLAILTLLNDINITNLCIIDN